MMNPRLKVLVVSLLAFTAVVLPRVAAAAENEAKFLRFKDDSDGGGKLQTAIVTYKNKAGAQVHLVAAVHVADTAYYKGLEKTFAGYDALLYEMVKPAGMGAPVKGERTGSTVSFIQTALKDILELDYQLDAVDYTPKNFVHADLTAEEFERLQTARGESMFTIILQQMLRELSKEQNVEVSDLGMAELLMALTSPDRSRHLKMLLARQFNNIEDQIAGLDGPNGSVILTERNKVAVKAIKSAVDQGQKNIGLFYGAAHMKGISEALRDMGFEQTDVEWRTAWDMTPKPGDIVVKQVKPKEEKK